MNKNKNYFYKSPQMEVVEIEESQQVIVASNAGNNPSFAEQGEDW